MAKTKPWLEWLTKSDLLKTKGFDPDPRVQDCEENPIGNLNRNAMAHPVSGGQW
jgi:hypothetical protein